MAQMSLEDDMVQTQYGWATQSETPPHRRDIGFWLKLPERHVYQWDGDGWFPVEEPHRDRITEGDLDHG
jgi:hypothetical protein